MYKKLFGAHARESLQRFPKAPTGFRGKAFRERTGGEERTVRKRGLGERDKKMGKWGEPGSFAHINF